MPFAIPKTAAEALALAEQTQGAYAKRDTRMLVDQDDFELREPAPGRKDPSSPEEDEDPVLLNDLKVQLEKAAAMIAGKPPEISVASNTDQDEEVSQRIEDFLTWWRREANLRYQRGVRNTLLYDEAQYLLLRGWLCGRLTLNPEDPTFPWRYTLLDPATVYPAMGGDAPLYIVHYSYPTVGEVRAEWGKRGEKLTEGKDATDNVTQVGLYTDTEMAVLVESEWVKKPTAHNYGFNPLLIITAKGAPYAATAGNPSSSTTDTRSSTRGDWVAYRGESFMTSARPAVEEKRKALAIAKAFLEKSVYPPVIMATTADVESADIPTAIGSKLAVPPGTSMVGVPPPAQALGGLSAVLGAFQDSENRAMFGPAVFGGQMPTTSGFDRSVAASSAQDPLYPFVEALKTYYEWLYRYVLTLFARFGTAPVSFLSTTAQGVRTAAARLEPLEALGADCRVEVRFRSFMLQDRVANAGMAVQLAREGIIDYDTARDEYLDIANPRAIGRKALRDQGWKNPQMTQLFALKEMAQDPAADPVQQMVAAHLYEKLLQSLVLELMQPPGGAQAPPAQPQMPPGMLPPQLQAPQAGLPPGMEGVGPPASAAPGMLPTPDVLGVGPQMGF